MEDFRALRYLAEKFYPEIPQFFYISVLVSGYKGNNAPGAGRHYSEAQLFTQKKDILIGNGGGRAGCIFGRRGGSRLYQRKNGPAVPPFGGTGRQQPERNGPRRCSALL